jgi:hypothetical protein
MITHMVADSVRCLNQFPRVNGISLTMSHLTIITGATTPDYNVMRHKLGTKVQVFEDHAPTNTPRSRSLEMHKRATTTIFVFVHWSTHFPPQSDCLAHP